MDCHTFYDAEYVKNGPGVPRCEKCGGLVKPDVVLYEEGLDSQVIQGAIRAITDADERRLSFIRQPGLLITSGENTWRSSTNLRQGEP